MKQPTHQTAFLAVVAIFAIPMFFLILVSALINKPAKGSGLSFQNVESQIDLEWANYVLEYRDRTLVLRNKGNQVSVTIVQGYSPVAVLPAYAVLRLDAYESYVITRLASGGNSGAFWFRVFKLSPTPVNLTPQDADPENGLSCVDPRLDEQQSKDMLVFERSANCADSAASRQIYEITLN